MAYVNLGGAWFGSGAYKLPLEEKYPDDGCSTCTITSSWDGTTAKLYGFKNEMVGGMLWLQGGASADATSVSVQLSPLTNGTDVISSTAVLCHNVTNYVTRDFEIFVASYVPILGMTRLSWQLSGSGPFEERDLPPRFRNAYTVNGNNQGVPNSPSVWSHRPDADLNFPDALIPHECKTSFTVLQNKSQGVWFDIYLSTSLSTGVYTGNITVKEGVTVSSTIPIAVTVRNGTIPQRPTLNYVAYVSDDDTNFRINGIAHGNGCETAECIATDRSFYNAIWRHRLIPIGDYKGTDTSRYPSQRYIDQLSGASFSQNYGYRGPGASTGVPVYSIGTYQHWDDFQSSVLTNAVDFCVMVSSWGHYFSNNFGTVRSFIYLEDEPANLTNINTWSTWLSTQTNCQHVSTYTVHGFSTVSWPKAAAQAPYLDNPATTEWITKTFTSTDWDNAADKYITTGSTQGWGYNGHPPFSGSCNATEDDGISCWMSPWGAYKKGVQGWFQWHTNSWFQDGTTSPEENPLWAGLGDNVAKTFGFDAYPSTSTAMGRTGFNASNGDGVLLYPGTDTAFPSANQGFKGPIASLRLKMLRRGQFDHDYLTMANQFDPSGTQTILNSMVPNALWGIDCFDDGDCSYAYGGRLWNNDPDDWEQARAGLADIIESGEESLVPETISKPKFIRGKSSFKGRVTFR